jgi:hypothetical protein
MSPPNRRELLHAVVLVEAKVRALGSRWQTLPGQERYELLQFANKANWLLIRCGVNDEMSGDPYYRSKAWRSLRGQVLRRDKYRCTTPGCGGTERLTVDHIVSRRAGGSDMMSNLTTRCGSCDASVKEDADGKRRGGGTPTARGCDASGTPRDPSHWWNENRSGLGALDRSGEPNRVSSKSKRPDWLRYSR